MVLNEIADDYENVDQIIFPNVERKCAKLGLVVERTHIVKALAELIEGRLAKAYLLSGREPAKELKGVPLLDIVEENFKTYFYITKEGLGVLSSKESWWPFDDDDNPRGL